MPTAIPPPKALLADRKAMVFEVYPGTPDGFNAFSTERVFRLVPSARVRNTPPPTGTGSATPPEKGQIWPRGK